MDSGRLQKLKLENKGFSIVEMLCAIIILTMVTAAISTIVLVSTKVYKSEVTDTNVQQDAQLAANRISEIIKDAVSVAVSGGASETEGSDLEIIKDKDKKNGYRVYLASDNNLMFEELSGDETSSGLGAQVLAGNITDFTADISEFEKNNIVKITFKVQNDSNDNRSYTANYVMKARNEDSNELTTKLTSYVSVSCPSVLYLEPGQTFYMDIQTSENVKSVVVTNEKELEDNLGVTVSISNKESSSSLYQAQIVVARDVHDDLERELNIVVSDGGSATAPQTTKILIRRVNDLKISYVVDNRNTTGDMQGLYEGAGTIFTFYANITDQNTRKNVNSDGEAFAEYKSTKTVGWSISAQIDGATVDVYKYLKRLDTTEENAASAQYEVIQDMPENFSFTVTAVSLHQTGSNKSNQRYSDIYGNLVINGEPVEIKDSVTISARERNKTKKVTDFFYIETDNIHVEPGQGQDAYGTTAIKIPFYINAKTLTNLKIRFDPFNPEENVTSIMDVSVSSGSIDFEYDNVSRWYYMTYTNNEIGADATNEEATVLCYVTIKVDANMSAGKGSVDYTDGVFNIIFTPFDNNNLKGGTIKHAQDVVIKAGTRRVKKVSLSVQNNADINALNTSSNTNTIVLEAKPTGYGTNEDGTVGVKYYGQQTYVDENGKTVPYYWDKNYESPYTMKWGFIEKDGTYHDISWLVSEKYITIDTEYYDEYLSHDSGYRLSSDKNYIYPTNDDKSGHKAIFAFKILKTLPDGKIRATSLHSLGGEYNKSGINYSGTVRGVYGELTIGNAVTLLSVDTNYVDVEPSQGFDENGVYNTDTVVDIPFYISADNFKDVRFSLEGNSYSCSTAIVGVSADKGKLDNNNNYNYLYDDQGTLADSLSDTILCHVFLKVDKNETGSSNNGLLKLSIYAHDNSSSYTEEKTEISIRIRKVTSLSLSVKDNDDSKDIDSLNVANNKIVIYATVEGYKTNDVDVFSKKDAGWEKNYKSPYEIKWYYVEKDGVTTHDISWLEENDYISNVTENNEKLSFTIDEKLPMGRIRAVSLHSIGTFNGVTYNKTGINYSGKTLGVYDEVYFGGTSSIFYFESKTVIVEPGEVIKIPFIIAPDKFTGFNAQFENTDSYDTKILSVETAVESGTGSFNGYSYSADSSNTSGEPVKGYINLQVNVNETGTFKLRITPYNSNSTTELTLKIRRVTDVSLKVSSTNGNITDSVITFDVNTSGTNFAQQTYKDENRNIIPYEWDSDDKYCSPRDIRWTYIDTNGNERDISKLTGITISTKDNSKLEFTVNTPLSAGTIIKATALHSIGKVGDTKTNRYGEGYGEVSSQVMIINGSFTTIDLIGVESNQYEVSKGGTVNIPIYLDTDNVSAIKVYLSNYASINSIVLSGQNYNNSPSWISITDAIKNSSNGGIATGSISVKVGDSQTDNLKLYIEIYKKNEYNNDIKEKTETIELKIK